MDNTTELTLTVISEPCVEVEEVRMFVQLRTAPRAGINDAQSKPRLAGGPTVAKVDPLDVESAELLYEETARDGAQQSSSAGTTTSKLAQDVSEISVSKRFPLEIRVRGHVARPEGIGWGGVAYEQNEEGEEEEEDGGAWSER